MKFVFDNNFPIHFQLVEQIANYIVSGYFKPTEKIPTVRELARLANVNHNTVQKALTRVEEIGLIFTDRTNGKFVTDDVGTINEVRDLILKKKINGFLEDMSKIGIHSVKVRLEKEENKEIENYEFVRMQESK